MPTRLLLEGPSIEELLAQVRAEHGDSAKIVAADKVRSGGFAGFFAKLRYEITVELPDERPPSVDLTAPRDILDLVDQTEAEEPRGLAAIGFGRARATRTPVAVPQTVALPEAVAAVPQTVAVAAPAAAASGRAASATAVVERVARPALAVGDDSPLLSTSSPSFARVLAALTRDTEILPERAFEPAPYSRQSGSAAALPRQGERRAVREDAAFEAVVAEGMLEAAAETPAPAPVAEAASTGAAADGACAALAGVGVPLAMLERLPAGLDLEQAATLVAARLPVAEPCPAGTGKVVVVVGEGRGAFSAARRLACDLALDPTHVQLAGQGTLDLKVTKARHITTPRVAGRRAEAARRAEASLVVAVDAGAGKAGAAWATEVVAALGADSVWLSVDAGRKLADIRRTVARLGRLDAVVLHGAGASTTPAEVLNLNIPVATVDDIRATPAAWADLLVSAVRTVELEEAP